MTNFEIDDGTGQLTSASKMIKRERGMRRKHSASKDYPFKCERCRAR